MNTPNDMNQRIKQNINRRIYTKTLKTIALLLVVCIALGGITHFSMVATNYNPNREKIFLTDENTSAYDVLYTTFYQLTHPGMVYLKANNQDTIPSKGFGNYETTARIQPGFEPVHLGPIPNAQVSIHHSTSTLQSTTAAILNEFHVEQCPIDDIIKDITSMPTSTYLDVSLGFKNPYQLQTIADIMNQEDIEVQYINFIDQALLPYKGAPGGLNTNEIFGWGFIEGYPDFILNSETFTSDQLRQSYLSHLQLLIDHPDFVSSIPDLSLERLETCLTNAKKELLADGLRIHVTQPQLLALIQAYPVSSILIHDTKATKYQ